MNGRYDGELMAKGQIGERLIFELLRRLPGVKTVWDATDDKRWQPLEVDFAVEYLTGAWRLIEAKTDYHLGVSGNVLFEIMRINHTSHHSHAGQLGWGCRTAANAIFIYAPSIERIYEIETEDFRRAFQQYTKNNRENPNLIQVIRTDNIKTTLAVLIPEDFIRNVKIYDIP